MLDCLRLLAIHVACVACAGTSKAFPPGWNGLAKTPPLGWRSWNAFGNRITQDMMIGAAEALVAKTRRVPGREGNVSLCDLGYCSVGVDEGWEGCGMGVNKTQHDASGAPTIASSFADTGGMVSQIHKMGLKAGWYLNGCKCGERTAEVKNYEGDIRSLHGFGFDGVKIDGCGAQRNQTLYAQLMKESGRNYTIENCHWGRCTDSDDSSCPTLDWCPFNWYRTSGDINSYNPMSWLDNLQTTIRFQDYKAPLSRPGCWAYPDMLEVGRVTEPAVGAWYTWNRAHFGAWCVVSAPLILGLELTDEKLADVLDIIGNEEALAVNQAWAGHPGMLVENVVQPPTPYNPEGVTLPSTSAADFDLSGGAGITAGKPDSKTAGTSSIRSGNPGDVSLIRVGNGVIGAGHRIDSVSMSFRYLAGYTPAPNTSKAAATVRVLLLDGASGTVLKELLSTPPLGNYSWDHFTQYSPPINVSATGLDLANDAPVVLALEVTNHDRNLQLPIDDKASGFDARISWAKPSAKGRNGPPADAQPARPPPLPVPLSAFGRVASVAGVETPREEGFGTFGTFGSGQLWAKPMPGGGAAALLINHSPKSLVSHSVPLASLNLTASSYSARDLWNHRNLGDVSGNLTLTVRPFDSAFVLLTPSAALVESKRR